MATLSFPFSEVSLSAGGGRLIPFFFSFGESEQDHSQSLLSLDEFNKMTAAPSFFSWQRPISSVRWLRCPVLFLTRRAGPFFLSPTALLRYLLFT